MTLFSKTTVLAASAAILVSAGAASAATVSPGVGTYTFSGPATLSASFTPNLSCTLSLTGNVQKTSDGGVVVTVTDGDATGGFLCGGVGFTFPWTAKVPASKIPADPTQPVGVMFENVEVSAAGSSCTDGKKTTLAAIFGNGDPISKPSYFQFNSKIGSCSVMGTVNAESDVNVTR